MRRLQLGIAHREEAMAGSARSLVVGKLLGKHFGKKHRFREVSGHSASDAVLQEDAAKAPKASRSFLGS